jgi:hypothetical protein
MMMATSAVEKPRRHCEEHLRRSNQCSGLPSYGLLRFARNDDRGEFNPSPYFFTLLASILIEGSSIPVLNALPTSNGFSMPR